MEKAESKDSAPRESNTSGTTPAVHDVPDPEEDDLDDLDGRRQFTSCPCTARINFA